MDDPVMLIPTTAYPWLARSSARAVYAGTSRPRPGMRTTTGGEPSIAAPAYEFAVTARRSWTYTPGSPMSSFTASAHAGGM